MIDLRHQELFLLLGLLSLGDVKVGGKGAQRPTIRTAFYMPLAFDPPFVPIVAKNAIFDLAQLADFQPLGLRHNSLSIGGNHMVPQRSHGDGDPVDGIVCVRQGKTHDAREIFRDLNLIAHVVQIEVRQLRQIGRMLESRPVFGQFRGARGNSVFESLIQFAQSFVRATSLSDFG